MSEYLKRLKIDDLSTLAPKVVSPFRFQMVDYAKGLDAGESFKQQKNHTIWSVDGYDLGFRKPGKEAEPDAKVRHQDKTFGPNTDDMTPTVWKSGQVVKAPASFEEIFHVFEELLKNRDDEVLEILAGVFYRSAYLLDYSFNEKEAPDFCLSDEIVKRVDKGVMDATGLPGGVFLRYLELIAWNEDVKYNAVGYNIRNKTGRQSNMLTYVHLISVLLGRMPLADFCYSFARSGGVATLSGTKVGKAFPWLREE